MDVDYLNLYKASFLNMPLGLFIIDKDKHILSWNDWLSSKTKYSADDVIGKRLNSLFQEVDHQRFDWAVEQTLSYKSPQFLSQILNSYLIPIEIEDDTYDAIEYMQQDIEILPLQNLEDNFALVIIKDVTSEVHQKNVLMKMGYKLEEESLRDSLTGSYNRRYLWEYLDQQLTLSKRISSPLSCIMFDLDHFKNINDTHGHEVGDKVLVEFTKIVLKIIRSSDVLVRYGGEEFIILLPNTDENSSLKMAERIRSSLERESINIISGVEITCSAGIALWTPENPDLSAKDLIKNADESLYKAKESGRNRIVSS